MAADGVGPMLCLWPIRSRDGTPMAEPPRFPLDRDRVRDLEMPLTPSRLWQAPRGAGGASRA